MAVKERSQIKGTDAQIKAFAGHNGVLAFATDTKSLHVLSGTAGTTTEFLPSNKVATKTELANYTPTSSFATVATSGNYNDLSGKPTTAEVGDIKLYAGSNVPNGWFRCDGSTIADMATNYPKLYAVLGTNVLPNYSDRVPLGASSSINTSVNAGLPEITGSSLLRGGKDVSLITDNINIGAVSITQEPWEGSHFALMSSSVTDPLCTRITINASKNSAIYGASTTVQPPAVKVAVLIKHD